MSSRALAHFNRAMTRRIIVSTTTTTTTLRMLIIAGKWLREMDDNKNMVFVRGCIVFAFLRNTVCCVAARAPNWVGPIAY